MKPRIHFLIALMSTAFGFSGCSVDMFSKSKPDADLGSQEKYQRVNPACSGLKIKKPELDPETFKSLIQCFNSNGSIPELAALVDEADSKTLEVSTALLNSAFLSQPQMLSDSRGIIQKLESEKKWDGLISGLHSALNDPERLRALIRLLSVKSETIKKTLTQFSPTETIAGVELFGRLVRSKSFRELQRKISESPLSVPERKKLVQHLTHFFRTKTRSSSAALLLGDMAAGKSASLWEYAFGSDFDSPEKILEKSSIFYSLLRTFGNGNGIAIRNISQFHRGFHHPIQCWNGAKVFNEPWKNLSSEIGVHSSEDQLLPFLTQFASLTAISVSKVCEIPPEFYSSYSSVIDILKGRTGGEYLGVLSRVFRNDFGYSAGYFIGEWGDVLADALSVIQDRPWFPDLVLAIAELDSNDRARMGSWFGVLLENKAAWSETLGQWTESDLEDFFSDLGKVMSWNPDELGVWVDSVQTLFESTRTHPWFQGWKIIATHSDEMGVLKLSTLQSFPRAAQALEKMAEDGRLASMLADIIHLLAGAGNLPEHSDVSVSEITIRKKLRHFFSGSELLEGDSSLAISEPLHACMLLDLRKSPEVQWDLYLKCSGSKDIKPSSVTFFNTFIERFISLPIPLSEKRAFISAITGKIPGLPALTADHFSTLIRIAKESSAAFIHLLGEFREKAGLSLPDWNRFFKSLESVLSDSRFVPVLNYVRNLRPLTGPYYEQIIGPAPLPNSVTLSKAVNEVECLELPNAQRVRTQEISDEYQFAVLGWERGNDGMLPLSWQPEELSIRLQNLSKTLQSSSLRLNLYQWVRTLPTKATAQWFLTRASDPMMVAVMDPVSRTTKVRWMTSLDRLESILVNSNFSYLLPENYGVKFINKFAESWGDEPRETWPREIQKKYSGRKRPPTLRETYEEVVTFLKWFERLGGLSKIPACVTSELAPKPWGSAPDLVVDFSIKAKAYNLKQTLSVIEENLPSSGHPSAGGMKLLRNLFWAVSSSQTHNEPVAFLQSVGDLGVLRSISRGLQSIKARKELVTIEDFIGGLGHIVSEPEFDRLLSSGITRALDNPEMISGWVNSIFKTPFSFSSLIVRTLSGIATDRFLGLNSIFVRTLGLSIPSGIFPEALVGDALVTLGKPGNDLQLRSYRSMKSEDPRRISYLVSRMMSAFPFGKVISALENDPLLRKDFLTFVNHALSVRQSNDEGLNAFFDLLASETHPEFRHMTALWCGKYAGSYVDELASNPDESALMIDALLRSAEGPGFKEFLDAFLRQLPD